MRDPRRRIALVGPSGTGKSEFARMVARELDKPLLVQRASDLLRPHVGESEEAIAEMFERATHDDTLLLIDEIDSLLAATALVHGLILVTRIVKDFDHPGLMVLDPWANWLFMKRLPPSHRDPSVRVRP